MESGGIDVDAGPAGVVEEKEAEIPFVNLKRASSKTDILFVGPCPGCCGCCCCCCCGCCLIFRLVSRPWLSLFEVRPSGRFIGEACPSPATAVAVSSALSWTPKSRFQAR